MEVSSNIDRILAIYQALYPTESDTLNEPSDPSKWVPENGRVNSKTPLYPFRKNAQDYWTSQDVQDWTTLGFAVPGNKKLDKSGRSQLETYLRENYYWCVSPNDLLAAASDFQSLGQRSSTHPQNQ